MACTHLQLVAVLRLPVKKADHVEVLVAVHVPEKEGDGVCVGLRHPSREPGDIQGAVHFRPDLMHILPLTALDDYKL